MWNFKRIALLTTAILALGFYIYYSDRSSQEQAESRIQSKKILQLPDKNQIISLLIENKSKDPVEISKQNNRWWIVKPFRYEAEDLVVDGLLSALTLTTWERSFPAREVNTEEMGLWNPEQKITVTLRTESGLEKRRLLIGRDAPMGKFIYARWEESGDIYMLYDQFAKSFDKSLYGLRKKRIFEITGGDISAMQVSLEGRNFALIKRGEKWEAEAKDSAPIDQVRVEKFLSDLTGLYAKEFLDGLDPKNPDLGLADRKYSIRLTQKDNTAVVFWMGKENKDKQAFYGVKEGEQTVVLIPETKIWEMPRSLKFFEKKEELAKKSEFDRVKVEKEKKSVEAVRIDGKWRLESGGKEQESVFNQAVNELIGYLQNADFGDPDPAIKEPPLTPEVVYVKLVTPGKISWEYTFYKKDNTIIGQIASQPGYSRLDESVWNEVSQYYQQISAVKKA